jgi:hypothetical protein
VRALPGAVAVACVSLLTSQAHLQTRPPGTGLIAGQVVNAESGAALAGVTVSLSEVLPPSGFARYDATARTDETGAFTFSNVPGGSFSVTADGEGYVPGGYGRRRPFEYSSSEVITLRDAQRLERITIELWRGATVSGRVLFGKVPLPEASVVAWRRHTVAGLARFVGVPAFQNTNADGSYRLKLEAPGEYVIAVRRRPVVGHHTVVFAPDARDLATARIFRVAPGDVVDNVDVTVRPDAGVTVSGRLERPSGKPIGDLSEVTLRVAGAPREDVIVPARIDKQNSFAVNGVSPGRYVLEVTLQTAFGSHGFMRDGIVTRMPLDVPSTGVAGLVVPIAEGTSASGRIVFDGSAPRSQLDLFLRSVEYPDRWPNPGDSIVGGARETFAMINIEPGRYGFHAYFGDGRWAVESMSLNGIDLATEPIESGADLNGIVVTASDRPAWLAGVVQSAGVRVRHSTVVAFPADRRVWPRAYSALAAYRTVQAIGGDFRFWGIMPGEYLVAAVDGRDMDEWPSESMLRRLEPRATPVRITRGTGQTISLERRTP